jgi:predicted RNA binding protein YcfA (HicA-like mRNA interferase family)
MPRKVRQLKADPKQAGFEEHTERGKGSHTVWVHPVTRRRVTISGHDGDDAQHYQERDVREAIREAAERA